MKKNGGWVVGEDVFKAGAQSAFFNQLNSQNAPPIFLMVQPPIMILHIHPVFDFTVWFSFSWQLGAWVAVWRLPQGLEDNLVVQFFHPKQLINEKIPTHFSECVTTHNDQMSNITCTACFAPSLCGVHPHSFWGCWGCL